MRYAQIIVKNTNVATVDLRYHGIALVDYICDNLATLGFRATVTLTAKP